MTDARTLGSHIGLAKAMRDYDLRRTVSFHGRVKKAQEFSATFPGVVRWMPEDERPVGEVWSTHVSGEMSAGRRNVLLRRFRSLEEGTRGLLSNARCLAEGVDVPAIDCVTFIDPKSSTIDIIQAVGRAIRKSPEKKRGVIVMSVFVSSEKESEQVLEDSSFKPVWDVLKALRAHDSVLAEELDSLRRSMAKSGTAVRRPEKIALDLPAGVSEQFARAFDVRLVLQTTATWEFWFGLLERFANREGHVRAPSGHVEDGHKLGRWAVKQRHANAAGDMPPDRRARLETLPEWTWDLLEARWEEGFAKLKQYAEREGHIRVPRDHVEDGHTLGMWLQSQRVAHAAGKKMSLARRARLETLSEWTTWDPLEAQWEEGFGKIQQFVEREGHARVPTRYLEDGYKLGQWATVQRRVHAVGDMPPDRQVRLETLPKWTWSLFKTQWEEGFAKLKQYAEREGHIRVPQDHVEDGHTLGRWVRSQRSVHAAGDMPPDRRRRLEAFPEWTWDPYQAQWEEGFAKLKQYAEREGHIRVPRDHVEDGHKLGMWSTRQRGVHAAGDMPPDRRRRLEAFPEWTWDPLEAQWEEGFGKVQQFVEREGHARVPSGHVEDGHKLGQWVSVQRRANAAGDMPPDRRRGLQSLTGWVWDAR